MQYDIIYIYIVYILLLLQYNMASINVDVNVADIIVNFVSLTTDEYLLELLPIEKVDELVQKYGLRNTPKLKQRNYVNNIIKIVRKYKHNIEFINEINNILETSLENSTENKNNRQNKNTKQNTKKNRRRANGNNNSNQRRTTFRHRLGDKPELSLSNVVHNINHYNTFGLPQPSGIEYRYRTRPHSKIQSNGTPLLSNIVNTRYNLNNTQLLTQQNTTTPHANNVKVINTEQLQIKKKKAVRDWQRRRRLQKSEREYNNNWEQNNIPTATQLNINNQPQKLTRTHIYAPQAQATFINEPLTYENNFFSVPKYGLTIDEYMYWIEKPVHEIPMKIIKTLIDNAQYHNYENKNERNKLKELYNIYNDLELYKE